MKTPVQIQTGLHARQRPQPNACGIGEFTLGEADRNAGSLEQVGRGIHARQ
nr:hypothetical protein [Microvirga soli]